MAVILRIQPATRATFPDLTFQKTSHKRPLDRQSDKSRQHASHTNCTRCNAYTNGKEYGTAYTHTHPVSHNYSFCFSSLYTLSSPLLLRPLKIFYLLHTHFDFPYYTALPSKNRVLTIMRKTYTADPPPTTE